MAFNWQTFKTRTLTAGVFVVVMLAGLLINRWTFFILFSVIHFGCWWEYLKLVEKIYQTTVGKVTKFVLMGIGYILFWLIGFWNQSTLDFDLSIGDFSISLKWVLFIFIVICLVTFVIGNKKNPRNASRTAVIGCVYISLALGFLVNLYYRDRIRVHDTTLFMVNFFPLVIIASLWINDTMAYIIGSLIGKTRMSEISPKKTWEGTIGGVILSATVVFLLTFYVFHFDAISYGAAFLALVASVFGTIGDLLESKLKRLAGVKDSGHIMPGHGGFLDRFDSLLLATPFVWLFVYFS